jgi:uncharacterized protein
MQTLILPGWQNSGPDHWQSRWEALYGYERVMQHDWMQPLRGDWIARLEDHLLSKQERLAHADIGLEAKKALNSQGANPSADTLLVAPPDAQREDFPLEMKSWRQPVLHQLPFPSICVISSNDPFCGLAAGRQMAQAWGSECVELGDKGHINAESGLGDWPQGRAMLERLAAQA